MANEDNKISINGVYKDLQDIKISVNDTYKDIASGYINTNDIYKLFWLSEGDRGVFIAGKVGATNVDTIDYISISTIGNATDFGDMRGGWLWDRMATTSNGYLGRGVFAAMSGVANVSTSTTNALSSAAYNNG